jgi:hypothetical protein
MKKVILISCGSKKKNEASKASELYIGAFFTYALAFSQKLKPDAIFILSAKYHLLELDAVISPYNVTLSNIPKSKRKADLIVLDSKEKKIWGNKVIKNLKDKFDLQNDKFIILAGKEYINPLENNIKFLEKPLEGKTIGKILEYLKNNS